MIDNQYEGIIRRLSKIGHLKVITKESKFISRDIK